MGKLKTDEEIIDHFSVLVLDEIKQFNCWVAGGSVLSYIDDRRINDLDIYFRNKQDQQECIDYLIDKGGIESMVNEWKTVILYDNKTYEFVNSYYESPQHCVDSFDFTVCGVATDGDRVYKNKNFYDHWRKKLLVFNEFHDPVVMLYHMQRYLTRGYWMEEEETNKLVGELKNSP